MVAFTAGYFQTMRMKGAKVVIIAWGLVPACILLAVISHSALGTP